ncbi:heme/copper-type cytochrome/quinol oxidase subunit 2 [Bacillus pakistanensis]|uniref:Heme/copper-type cytochrome/quinol oxidase subunit 2 n=2 Tax=Rossellomorea pakistanensis TaxID=992288 RepID=A0ABS2NHZ3_9BACI|nr:heme/copper-type cytochrome/quinol oxidase subunit 2 [Bacillus pakistanensis]
MFILASTIGGFNIGDLIFQLTMLLIVIGIPVVLILTLFVFSRRNKRLNRIEEKVDKLLSDNENKD